MELKTFIEQYSTICAKDENFTVDLICQMIDDYNEIILPKDTDDSVKYWYGVGVFQGFFVSALIDNNCGVSSELDKFIIDNCQEIVKNYEKRHPINRETT